MSYPRFDREFIVYTDASNIGVGGVLSQRDDHGHEKVIAYASRTFHGSEEIGVPLKRRLMLLFGLWTIFQHIFLVRKLLSTATIELYNGCGTLKCQMES